jgi:hypothetical protein
MVPLATPGLNGVFAATLSLLGILFLVRTGSVGSWSQDPGCSRGHDGLAGLMSAFPAAGQDSASSLGKFRLSIAPQFRPLLEGMPDHHPHLHPNIDRQHDPKPDGYSDAASQPALPAASSA